MQRVPLVHCIWSVWKHTIKVQFVHFEHFDFRHALFGQRTMYHENTPPGCHSWRTHNGAHTSRICTRKNIFVFWTQLERSLRRIQNYSKKFEYCNLKFAFSFKRTFVNLEKALSNLTIELSNSWYWMSNSCMNLPHNTKFEERFFTPLDCIFAPSNANSALFRSHIKFFANFALRQPKRAIAILDSEKEFTNALG